MVSTTLGSGTTSYGYNGLRTRVSKSGFGGARTYKRDGAGVTAPVLSDTVSTMVPGVSERSGGVTRTLATDRLGSMARMSNPSQTVIDTATYDAFGVVLTRTGSSPTQQGFASAWGYQEDVETALKLLGHRYYDPATGRFLTRDPIGSGMNWYAYCDNNPLKRLDPHGLWWHNPGVVIVDPNFKGKVFGVGEPKRGSDLQSVVQIMPGYMSSFGMDIDLLVVVMPDGTKRRYFLMGDGPSKSFRTDSPEYFLVGPDGRVYGPNVIEIRGPAEVLSERWNSDIKRAKKNPLPPNRQPFKAPYSPSYWPDK